MVQLLNIKSSRPTEVVTLTPTAAAKVKELLVAEGEDSEESMALRVAVKPGGCSGFSYDMFFDTQIDDEDLVAEFGGVKVAVDPMSAERVRGSTLDYREGLMDAGFSINNPNQVRSCGCGNSFG